MTRDEFVSWLAYHTQRFPTLVDKVKANPSTMQVWQNLLAPISLADAKAVTDDMAAGNVNHPAAYEWDRLPQIVLAEVRARNDYRARQAARDQRGSYRGAWAHVTSEDATCVAAYREYLRLHDLGYEHDDCCCAVRTLMNAGTQWQRERYDQILQETLCQPNQPRRI